MCIHLFKKFSFLYSPKTLPWIIIGFGVILRLVQYLSNRSLWIDESFLALNIIDRSFSELLQPLKHHQGAPFGFLIIEKIATQIFNNGEYALRLYPLLSGIASMFVFYAVARYIVKPHAVLIAVMLFAISEPLIYYSSEVKQYSCDVLIALLILYVVIVHIQPKRLTALHVTLFGTLGATVIWFSHPSVFILAGVGLGLALFRFIQKDWAIINRLSIVYLLWILSFATSYMVTLHGLSSDKKLLNYWAGGFMPFPPSSMDDLIWFFKTFLEIFNDPVGLSLSGIAAFAFIIGSVSLFSEKKEQFFIMILPIFIALLASGFSLYPFRGRLILFCVPILLLFIAKGAEDIIEKIRYKPSVIGFVFLVFLIVPPFISASKILIEPIVKEEIKPAINYIRENEVQGDVLYLYWGSWPAYTYYSKLLNFRQNNYIAGVRSPKKWDSYIKDIDKLRGNKRVWILFSHVYNWGDIDEEKFFLYYLNSIGKKLVQFNNAGASAYLYDLSDKQIQEIEH